MARPIKNGVDYFPLDTNLDTKFDLIEAEFGLTGFAVVVKLFQKIYGEHGYYCEWTYEVALLFSRKIGEGYNAVSEIVSAAIKRGIFDKNLYEKYEILTSEGIQKRYFEAVNRRAQVEVKAQYLLVNDVQSQKNVNINRVNVCKNSKNVCNNSQTKVNKTKTKETKVLYGTYKNVHLSDDDLQKLKAEFPDWNERIERLSEYIASSGKNYKNHLATIRSWARKEKPQQQSKSSSYDVDKIKKRFNNFKE
ncbi:MAG: DUF4373 domain-containing protein [Clostridia bacterium]|nr:DUF4373 domain-containing protein [Clostridia bacterium]